MSGKDGKEGMQSPPSTPTRDKNIVVEKIWMTVVFKSWVDSTHANATILISVPEGLNEIQIRQNKGIMPENSLELRKTESRRTYNAYLEFIDKVVFESFPFRVHALVCELELSGIKDRKYDLSIPQVESDVPSPSDYTNLASFKRDMLTNGVILASKAVFVDSEITGASNEIVYHPRIYFRLLRLELVDDKCMKFYFPYFSLWVLVIFAYWNHVIGNLDGFIDLVAGAILSLVVGSEAMINGQSKHERMFFNFGVLFFVLMICPHFKMFLLAPLLMLIPILYSAKKYRQWLKKYLVFKNFDFLTEEGNDGNDKNTQGKGTKEKGAKGTIKSQNPRQLQNANEALQIKPEEKDARKDACLVISKIETLFKDDENQDKGFVECFIKLMEPFGL